MVEVQDIDLAKEPGFVLGRLAVAPDRRELRHEDGRREIIEYRVMQVLVALALAEGGVVSRDELLQRCWSGRIVGEDAINRVISRLRRVASGIGSGSFDIETITKIGYRLGRMEDAEAEACAVKTGFAPTRFARDRRQILLGMMCASAVAAGGGAWFYARSRQQRPSAEVTAIMTQAWQSWWQGSEDGLGQAIGLYRRATELAPDDADAWGLLGCAYDASAHQRPKVEAEALRDLARAAGRQALALDTDNAYGRCALAFARPMNGNWLLMERELRRARAEHPDGPLVIQGLATLLLRVGRCEEAARELARQRVRPRPPLHYYFGVMAEWGADRIERAERLMEEGTALYPAHRALWLANVRLALFGGRPGRAIAVLQDAQSRPVAIDEAFVGPLLVIAHALQNRAPALVEPLVALLPDRARLNNYEAQHAILTAAALGYVDQAFALLDAFYFSRPFAVPDQEWSPNQPAETRLDERATAFLFLPVMRPVRADPRFGRLTAALGLDRYWRQAGVQPDCRSMQTGFM